MIFKARNTRNIDWVSILLTWRFTIVDQIKSNKIQNNYETHFIRMHPKFFRCFVIWIHPITRFRGKYTIWFFRLPIFFRRTQRATSWINVIHIKVNVVCLITLWAVCTACAMLFVAWTYIAPIEWWRKQTQHYKQPYMKEREREQERIIRGIRNQCTIKKGEKKPSLFSSLRE